MAIHNNSFYIIHHYSVKFNAKFVDYKKRIAAEDGFFVGITKF